MGLVLPQTVNVRITPVNYKRYKELGYDIPMVFSNKSKKYVMDLGSLISINVEDLPPTSKEYINVQCDYCGKIYSVRYIIYNRIFDQIVSKCACKECKKAKTEESNMIIYGVTSTNKLETMKKKSRETCMERFGVPSAIQSKDIQKKQQKTNIERYGVPFTIQNEECNNKRKATNLKKYGVENPSLNKDVQKKIKETNLEKYGVTSCFELAEFRRKAKDTMLERYGVEYTAQSEELLEKMKHTNIERYGVEYAMQNDIFKEKARATNLERYGSEYIMSIPEFQRKAADSLYINGNINTSIQQYNIYLLLKKKYTQTQLNYPIGNNLHGDIVIDNIDFEIDYGGHDLSVKFGTITQSEFLEKQIKRDKIVKSEGYKLIRLISDKERKIPTQEKLIEIFELSKKFFEDNPERSWIEFHIEKGIYRNAINKDGVLFNFGKLIKAVKYGK